MSWPEAIFAATDIYIPKFDTIKQVNPFARRYLKQTVYSIFIGVGPSNVPILVFFADERLRYFRA